MYNEELVKKWKEEDEKLYQESNRFIIQFEEVRDKDLKILAKNLEEEGEVLIHHPRINAVTVDVKPDRVLKVTNLHKTKGSFVKKIWKDRRVRIALDKTVKLIKADKVWSFPSGGSFGKNIKVAVVDTGVDPEHPDLEGRVIETEDFTDEGYFDGNGHGTHVTGTIAGDGTASNGKYKGVAPKTKIIAAKVLDSMGSGWMSGVMNGIEWAADQGAQVINLSLGSAGPCDGTDPISQLCDQIVDEGVVVCVAAGNSGPESSTVGSPGCAKKVITIGASDDNDKIAYFSSRGPTSDNRIKPDICWPGVNVIAARAKKTSMGSPQGDFYTEASGTSMATPHCAGVIALLLEDNPKLGPERIKDLLMNNAHDMGYDDNTDGKGRGDALDAYEDILKLKKE
ncbi:MAG: S8 family peptidase [Candidatus Hodarchaeota archaeon]